MVAHALLFMGMILPSTLVFMDVSKTPGPSNSQLDTDAAFTTCIHSKRFMGYTRHELLRLRRPSKGFIDQETFHALKLNSIFRYRGRRGGRRKMEAPVVINHRRDYVVRPKPCPHAQVLTSLTRTQLRSSAETLQFKYKVCEK